MSDTPAAVRHSSKEEAVQELQSELDNFFAVFEKSQTKRLLIPSLVNWTMNERAITAQTCLHHLRQFGWSEYLLTWKK